MHILAAIQDYAWRILWIGAVLTVLEWALPQSRYSAVSRARAVVFWSVYILITASATTLLHSMWANFGLHRWYTLRIGELFRSEYLAIRALGWVGAPVLAGIFAEFFYYWFHRLQHALPFLWRFHEVHHSIRELSAWNCNHHVTEEIFRIPFITLPISFLIGADAGPVPFLVGLILGMQGLLEHSCTMFHLGPIRYVIADNRFHRIHHSIEGRHLNKNFGSFTSVWDLVFRTAHFPKKDEWPDTGVPGTQEPTTVSEFLFMPLRPKPTPLKAETALNR